MYRVEKWTCVGPRSDIERRTRFEAADERTVREGTEEMTKLAGSRMSKENKNTHLTLSSVYVVVTAGPPGTVLTTVLRLCVLTCTTMTVLKLKMVIVSVTSA